MTHISKRIPLVLAFVFLAIGTNDSGVRAQSSKLRVLFYGYVETKPHVAIGIIDGDRVLDVEDVPFLRHGAEISPDGRLVAFDTCRKGDRGLNIVRIDGSDERRLVDLDGDYCVQVRWSRDGTRCCRITARSIGGCISWNSVAGPTYRFKTPALPTVGTLGHLQATRLPMKSAEAVAAASMSSTSPHGVRASLSARSNSERARCGRRTGLNADSVTLRDLLTMSHGIEDSGPVGFRTAYSGEFSSAKLLELLAEYRQSGKPGQFQYANLGYNILGLVLDPRRRDGWKDVVKRQVLDPLGMRETSARVSDFKSRVIALPHDYGADGSFRRIRLGKADPNMHAAGGHFATPRDLARFVAAHVSSGRVDGVEVFRPETIALAHREHIDQNRGSWPFDRFGWGYGWDLSTYGDETIVHRFGAFSGYRSHMSFMPARGIGVVVLVNGSGPAATAADVMATFIYDRLSGRSNVDAGQKLRMVDLQARADALKT